MPLFLISVSATLQQFVLGISSQEAFESSLYAKIIRIIVKLEGNTSFSKPRCWLVLVRLFFKNIFVNALPKRFNGSL